MINFVIEENIVSHEIWCVHVTTVCFISVLTLNTHDQLAAYRGCNEACHCISAVPIPPVMNYKACSPNNQVHAGTRDEEYLVYELKLGYVRTL